MIGVRNSDNFRPLKRGANSAKTCAVFPGPANRTMRRPDRPQSEDLEFYILINVDELSFVG